MKNLVLIISIILLSSACFSQIQKETNSDYKLSYEEFQSRYGVDDTSIAIIDIFFDKRENSAGGKMSFLAITTGIVVITPPIGAGLMTISTPLFISGMITRHKYNRNNLLKALENYKEDKILATSLKRKVVSYLEIETANLQEELLLSQMAVLKTNN